jgi:hypothetical protein
MNTLFRALVVPLVKYCCQLWTPLTLGAVRQLEGVQRTFTSTISGMEKLNYVLGQAGAPESVLTAEEAREVCFSVFLYKCKTITGLAPTSKV